MGAKEADKWRRSRRHVAERLAQIGGEEAAALSAFEADCIVGRGAWVDDGEMKCCFWATEKI
jgi:hypothetical protein